MTYLAKPKLHHPKLVANSLGYTRRDYEGSVSTLCAGCGHDSISAAIVQAIYDLALQRFSRRADQCLFIDDRPENIEAGEAVGIAGHHFTSATSLENELKDLGLA